MLDLLRRITRAVTGLCRRRKPPKGPIPLWIVLRMGDKAVMVLARHRGSGIEQWVWVWPLDNAKLLGHQLLCEAARPNYFADLRGVGRAWQYANEAGREWRKAAEAKEDE